MKTNCTNCIDVTNLGQCQPVKSDEVLYSGPSLFCSGIDNKDSITVALQKIDYKLCSAPVFGLQEILESGNIAEDIGAKFISSTDPLIYTEILYNSVTSGSFVKIGGLSTEYLMADGSVSSITDFITQTITNGDTTHAPSGDVVFDALKVITDQLIPVSATQTGFVNNIALQELGGVDKLINGVRIGQGVIAGLTNTVLGTSSMGSITTGSANTAMGHESLMSATTGGNNSAFGKSALRLNTTGHDNSAFGLRALAANISGNYNVAFGEGALEFNTTGHNNSALGEWSLRNNTIGAYNVAVGVNTMTTNIDGNSNVAVGGNALSKIISGYGNVAIGITSLENTVGNGTATNGGYNVGVGNSTLQLNTSGAGNTALGGAALARSVTASQNIAVGYQAGNAITGSGNVVVATTGFVAGGGGITSGTNNMILSPNNGQAPGITTGSGNVIVGKATGLTTTLANTVIISDGVGNQRMVSNTSFLTTLPLQTIALITGDATGKAVVTKEYLSSVSSGVVTGSGVPGQVTFWTGTNVQSGDDAHFWDNTNKRLGIGTNVPTHPLTIGSTFAGSGTATGIVLYRTVDQTTNFERLTIKHNTSNQYLIGAESGGTGQARPIVINANGRNFLINDNTNSQFAFVATNPLAGSINAGIFRTSGVWSSTSGISTTLQLATTYQHTGTAGARELFISPFLQTVGSGTYNLVDIGTNTAPDATGTHTSVFSVSTGGVVRLGTVPVTSAGTYDILTRNISTGVVEKILSSSVASSARTININGVVQDLTTNREWRAAQDSSGILNYAGISIASSTQVNVGAAFGYIVNNESNPLVPTYTAVTYPGASNITVPTLGTGLATYVLLNSAGALVFQNTFPTSAQRKSMIFLSKIGHPAGLITTAGDEPDFMTSPVSQFRDLFQAFNYINQGVYVSANGVNLNLNLSAGTIVGDGINFVADKTNPNNLSVSSSVVATFLRRTQNGNGGAATTLIDPANYDVGGTITAVGGAGGRSTIQYVYYVPGLGMVVQYGQTFYANLNDAIAAVGRENFVVYPSLIRNAILIGMIALRRDATDLSNTAQAQFFRADIFGQAGGSSSGISTATLQGTYNNSAVPQIAVTDALGAFTIKNSKALDTSTIQEWQNIAGTTVMSITGNGLLSATNTGATQINGLDLINNGTANSQALNITNVSTGRGALITNNSAGRGLVIANNNIGSSIFIANGSTGTGYAGDNGSTGAFAIFNSTTGSTGDLLQFRKNNVITVKFDQNGLMSATNTGVTQTTGISLTNNGTSGSDVLVVNSTGGGRGALFNSSGTSIAAAVVNSGTGSGLYLTNSSTGTGSTYDNVSTGALIRLNSQTASTGNLLMFLKNSGTTTYFDQNGMFRGTNSGSTSTLGIDLVNNGTTGTKVITVSSTNTGRGIEVSNTAGGAGQVISNGGSGTGMYVLNSVGGSGINGDNISTGPWMAINSQTASTGDLLRFTKNSVTTTKIDQNGILTTPPPIISTAPTTSAGTYDILTRNTSTGQVEKIPSSTVQLTTTGVKSPIRTITADTTALVTDYTLLADAASNPITLGLPAASSVSGQIFCIKKINNTTNNITIDPNGGELIDFASTYTLSTYLQTVMIQSNGTAWYILSQN